MHKRILLIHVMALVITFQTKAQTEPDAGKWKTWLISSVKPYRLPSPPPYKDEIAQIQSAQNSLNAKGMEKIIYWNSGAPGYRWYAMALQLWTTAAKSQGPLVNLLMGTAIYDATIAAWDSKYAHNRLRPFRVNSSIKQLVQTSESPSYPCEHSVAAGVAVTLISHFYPNLADSVKRMAQDAMNSRVAAGVVFPSDTRAGFELGKRIAEKEIEQTKDFIPTQQFDGKIPTTPGLWKGKDPMLPLAGKNKTVVLKTASEFRPSPPPDFAKEMEELKSFKHNFYSRANAFYYGSQPVANDLLTRKIFEYNIHTNPPRVARVYASINVATYDGFAACWDAKYTYWGIRPDQYDSTYTPLLPTPPFPGYPSGHAMMVGIVGELFPYFFPYDEPLFKKMAIDGAESRFQAGIHFRSDNEAGLTLGKKVAAKVVEKLKVDGVK